MDWRMLSGVPGIAWPAIPSPQAAPKLALLYQLEQSQWLPAARLRELQARQLEGLLRHAHESVPYYRQRWGAAFDPVEAAQADGFARLPLLQRRDLLEHYQDLQSGAVPREHGAAAVVGTSGSTGTPIRVRRTQLSNLYWSAITLRDHRWHRRRLDGKLASIRSGVRRGVFDSWGAATDEVVATAGGAMTGVEADAEAQLAWLQSVEPAYLMTYPSLLAELARLSLERGARLPGLRQVRTHSELLDPDLRRLCAEAWNAPLVDVYSAGEVGYLALQCPEAEQHYHVQSESVLLEVLDDTGAACAPGQAGRVVVTDLSNHATPLVRYDIGDYAVPGPACSCGRGLPVLSRIAGRVRNMLVTADGKRYWPRIAPGRFGKVAPIRQCQLAQIDHRLLELRLVSASPLSPAQEEQIRALVLQQLPAGLTLRFHHCDRIPRGAGGKFEDFVSELAA